MKIPSAAPAAVSRRCLRAAAAAAAVSLLFGGGAVTVLAAEEAPGAACETSVDCVPEVDYCSSDGTCLPMGACSTVDDCDNGDNFYFAVNCVGTLQCEDGMCGKICSTLSEREPPEQDKGDEFVQICSDTSDCGDEKYCASDGTCHPIGGCSVPSDCSAADNGPFAIPLCIGTFECREGTCSVNCDSSDARDPDSCTQDEDCLGDSFCAQGTCMEQGTCKSPTDCVNPANFMWSDKKCEGPLDCDANGRCDRICGIRLDDGGAADVNKSGGGVRGDSGAKEGLEAPRASSGTAVSATAADVSSAGAAYSRLVSLSSGVLLGAFLSLSCC